VHRSASTARVVDAIALCAAGILLLVVALSAWRHHTDGLPAALLVLAAIGLYVSGRLVPTRVAALAVLWALALSVGAMIARWPDILSGEPLAPPTGYGNANGSLLALGAMAALGAATVHRSTAAQLVAAAAALGLLGATSATRSQAAVAITASVLACLLVVLVCKEVSGHAARRAAVVTASLLGFGTIAVLTVTVALAVPVPAVERSPGMSRVVTELSERRTLLWRDAVDLAQSSPWTGLGPGAFSTTSAVARADADTRFAHSLPLETAAEVGIPAAVAVLIVLVAIGLGAAMRTRGGLQVVAVGAVCVFAAQSFIDYTYRYPAVLLGWAMLAGTLVGAGRMQRTSPYQ
jgi:O-antigen ligase